MIGIIRQHASTGSPRRSVETASHSGRPSQGACWPWVSSCIDSRCAHCPSTVEFHPTNTLSNTRDHTVLVTSCSDIISSLLALQLAITHRTGESIPYLRIGNLDRDFRPIGSLGQDTGCLHYMTSAWAAQRLLLNPRADHRGGMRQGGHHQDENYEHPAGLCKLTDHGGSSG